MADQTPNRTISGASQPPQGTGFYVWSAPGAGATVHLHLAVIDRLSREIRDAAAGARGHKAVCGLLLGRTPPDMEAIVVEDSLPLPCSDLLAPPSYFLNAGKGALSEKLAQWAPGPDKRLWAVGYYQHQKDGELTLHDDEVALFQRDFPPPGKVMLLTASEAAGRPIAGFFPRTGDEIPRQTPLPFPLSRMELRQAADRGPAPPLSVPPTAQAKSKRRFTQYDAIRWTSIGIVVFALAVIAISEYPRLWPASRGETPAETGAAIAGSELRLALDGAPNRVVVTWNRSARAIADSLEGTLSVTDQGTTQILMLTRADLTAGSLVYFPNGNDVTFRLEVTTRNGRQLSERARFLAPPRRDNPRRGADPQQ